MITIIKEGARMFRRRIHVAFHGTRRYEGNAREICQKIVKDCFNGKYFQVSNGHFNCFYTRDFGWIIESLLKLDHQKEVHATLSYALERFSSHGAVTTSISPSGKCFNFPNYAPDSLAMLIRSLRLAKAEDLLKSHKSFLNKQIEAFDKKVMDKETGLVRKDVHFSSIKDHAKRKSSCYDNCMAAMLCEELEKIKTLDNPFKKYDTKEKIKKHFWKEHYFIDDLSGNTYIAGDANIFPFWTGVITNKEMMKKALQSIQREGLHKPFPLKYTKNKLSSKGFVKESIFASDYDHLTIRNDPVTARKIVEGFL